MKHQYHHQATYPRHEIITPRIQAVGRFEWKHEIGDRRRSIAETTMFRLQVIFNGHKSLLILIIRPLSSS